MKALIPAAGLGTRWYPWSRVIPKELVPVGKYPALHYVLDETVAAGITEIGIIVNRTKELIRSYVEEVWRKDYPGIRIEWFFQDSPRGVGDALLCAKDWVAHEATAVLYPDEIHPKGGGMPQICHAFHDRQGCWVGLLSKKQKRRQAALAVRKIEDNTFRVIRPDNRQDNGSVAYGTGRYIFETGFRHVDDATIRAETMKGRELDDDALFKTLWDTDIRGIVLREPVFDTGDPANWSFAVSSFHKMRFPGRNILESEDESGSL